MSNNSSSVYFTRNLPCARRPLAMAMMPSIAPIVSFSSVCSSSTEAVSASSRIA